MIINKLKNLSKIILLLLITVRIDAREDSLTVPSIIENIINAQKRFDPIQYEVQMQFKAIETDTFEIREFTIHSRSNPENGLYGYDWRIEEYSKLSTQPYTLTILAIPDGYYTIIKNSQEKRINHTKLPEFIEPGSYYETLRNYFLLEQITEPFTSGVLQNITSQDSANHLILQINTREWATRSLVLNKENYLPVNYTTVIKSNELGLSQILKVYINYTDTSRQLHDSVFSPEYYKSIGYVEKYNEKKYTATQPELLLEADKLNRLFNYPFHSTSHDTTFLSHSKGKYILLDFWFASCLPCLKSMPTVNVLANKYRDVGLEVFGINCVDKAENSYLISRLKDKNINFPLLFGSQELIQSIGITSFPTYLLIYPNGKTESFIGEIDKVENALESIFEK